MNLFITKYKWRFYCLKIIILKETNSEMPHIYSVRSVMQWLGWSNFLSAEGLQKKCHSKIKEKGRGNAVIKAVCFVSLAENIRKALLNILILVSKQVAGVEQVIFLNSLISHPSTVF